MIGSPLGPAPRVWGEGRAVDGKMILFIYLIKKREYLLLLILFVDDLAMDSLAWLVMPAAST
ncbi:hypothetical protein [Pseudomonas paraeruginosa]|uniref:hypothetical protein n=1 Tax=Pseudomonas paraeruginosa TaxID=2994495 RepID=UPI0039FBC26D